MWGLASPQVDWFWTQHVPEDSFMLYALKTYTQIQIYIQAASRGGMSYKNTHTHILHKHLYSYQHPEVAGLAQTRLFICNHTNVQTHIHNDMCLTASIERADPTQTRVLICHRTHVQTWHVPHSVRREGRSWKTESDKASIWLLYMILRRYNVWLRLRQSCTIQTQTRVHDSESDRGAWLRLWQGCMTQTQTRVYDSDSDRGVWLRIRRFAYVLWYVVCIVWWYDSESNDFGYLCRNVYTYIYIYIYIYTYIYTYIYVVRTNKHAYANR
jgi:hypothetical protein